MTDPFFTYRARVEDIIDGDTLDLVLDCGFGHHFHTRVRLVGVDTHEIYGVKQNTPEYDKGRAEAAFVSEWLRMATEGYDGSWPLVVGTLRDRTGKFGRYLAEVYRRDTGASLTDALLTEFPSVAD